MERCQESIPSPIATSLSMLQHILECSFPDPTTHQCDPVAVVVSNLRYMVAILSEPEQPGVPVTHV